MNKWVSEWKPRNRIGIAKKIVNIQMNIQWQKLRKISHIVSGIKHYYKHKYIRSMHKHRHTPMQGRGTASKYTNIST